MQCTPLSLGYADNGKSLYEACRQWEGSLLVMETSPIHETAMQATAEPFQLLADLKICGKTGNLQRGKQLHEAAVRFGHGSSLYVTSAIITMYARCGSMLYARQVFESLERPNVVSWNVLILGYADNGQGLIALQLFARMNYGGPPADSVTFVAALKACNSLPLKCRGRAQGIHNLVLENACELDCKVQSTLIDAYSKLGSVHNARQVFDSVRYPDVVSWTVLIMGYAENGHGVAALNLFRRMRKRGGLAPNSVTLVAALKACISVAVKADGLAECRKRGEAVHVLAVENGCDSDIKLQNTLIDMYAKSGSMLRAHQVFSSMNERNSVSWNALMLGYAENGRGFASLHLFREMVTGGFAPDSVAFVASLKACASLAVDSNARKDEERRGKAVHNLATENGRDSDMRVQSSLIDMYSKCGSMVYARHVFNSMKEPDVVGWNALILGYADNGQGVTALDLLKSMEGEGIAPDSVTFAAALKACGLVGDLELGRTIHSGIVDLDVVLLNCLVDFYAKCGSLAEAQAVFELHSEKRNVVTWTSLLAGFSTCGDHQSVFRLLKGMQDAGLHANSVTLLSVLACCNHAGLVEKGRECFEAMPTKYGVIPCLEHYNCMVDIFGRADKLEDAMALLKLMPCSPNSVTWTSLLGACLKWDHLEIGRLAFQSLVSLNDKDARAYVLMGQIYGTRGLLREQDMVMVMAR